VIQTKNGTRLLQLKNPWAHKSWKGRYSSRDTVGWKDIGFRQEVGYNPELAIHQDDGIFWVCWDDILQYFQNFHLSWNPYLFKYRLVTHGYWPLIQGPKDDTFNVGYNPQYILNFSQVAIKKKATIWLLISRHVTKQEQSGVEVSKAQVAKHYSLAISIIIPN
jgi:calpain-7